MDIYQLVEMGLAGIDRDRIEIVDLEPAEVAEGGVVGLSAIVSQLAHNATELLSVEGEKVSISGRVVPDGYSLSIVDHGLGMSDEFLEGLNQVLSHPRDPGDGSASGVQLVAGLAARHGIWVRLEHGHPGVTAKVTIPPRLLVEATEALVEASVDSMQGLSQPDLTPSRVLPIDTEEFLENVFGPLRDGDVVPLGQQKVVEVDLADDVISLAFPERSEETEPLQGYRRSRLSTRVPGRNYNESEAASSHTKPGEAAVEIKLALDDFTRGRQAANEPADEAGTGSGS